MIDLKNQFTGNGDQPPKPACDGDETPKPGEETTSTAQNSVQEDCDAERTLQENAMWAAYADSHSTEGDLPDAEDPSDEDPSDEDPDDEDPDDEDLDDEAAQVAFDAAAQVAFDAAAAANLARKSAGAQRRRDDSKAVNRAGRNLRCGLIDHNTVGKFLQNNPAGTQKGGKNKKIVGGTDGRRVEVKLTPGNEVYKQSTTPFGKKPVQKPEGYEKPMYMREEDLPPMEFVPIPADDGGITESNAD